MVRGPWAHSFVPQTELGSSFSSTLTPFFVFTVIWGYFLISSLLSLFAQIQLIHIWDKTLYFSAFIYTECLTPSGDTQRAAFCQLCGMKKLWAICYLKLLYFAPLVHSYRSQALWNYQWLRTAICPGQEGVPCHCTGFDEQKDGCGWLWWAAGWISGLERENCRQRPLRTAEDFTADCLI